jgi:hypothetical protein
MNHYLNIAKTQHVSMKEMEEYLSHLKDTTLLLQNELVTAIHEVQELTAHVETQQLLMMFYSIDG